MTLDIEVGGHTYLVTVEPNGPRDSAGGRFRVTIRSAPALGQGIASETVVVDARRTDLGLSVLFPEARSVDVAVTHGAAGAALVQFPHVDVPTIVNARQRGHRSDSLAEAGEQRIVASMPGRVLKVLVAVGDEVSAGQAVVVIEAMKMENDLKVLRAGRVRQVLVTEASSVEAGRLLVVVE